MGIFYDKNGLSSIGWVLGAFLCINSQHNERYPGHGQVFLQLAPKSCGMVVP